MSITRNYRPCGHRVLVRLKKINEATEEKSKFGIVLAIKDKKYINREKMATCEAYVIRIGSQCWTGYGDGSAWAEVNDLVDIVKLSGQDHEDIEESEIYRVINDVDVVGVWEGEGLK
jgi:co-chaperonin GroES (HSP10)